MGQAERANLSLQSVESSYLMVADAPSRKEQPKSGVLKVKPEIIDTYPSIYQDLLQYEDSAMHQLHPEAAKIKEQYLYLSNIQSVSLIVVVTGYRYASLMGTMWTQILPWTKLSRRSRK